MYVVRTLMVYTKGSALLRIYTYALYTVYIVIYYEVLEQRIQLCCVIELLGYVIIVWVTSLQLCSLLWKPPLLCYISASLCRYSRIN